MTIDQMHKLYHAEPFFPFEIRMANGDAIHVPSREFLLAPPKGRLIFVYDPEDESTHMIDLLLINDVKIATNGARS